MTQKTKRGGLRNPPGGAPRKPSSKQPFLVKLPPQVIDWLRGRKAADPRFSMGGWIGDVTKAAIDKLNQPSGAQPADAGEGENGAGSKPKCPECGSKNVGAGRGWRCIKCGHTWQD